MAQAWNTALDYWYRATDKIAAWPGAALTVIIVLAVVAVVW